MSLQLTFYIAHRPSDFVPGGLAYLYNRLTVADDFGFVERIRELMNEPENAEFAIKTRPLPEGLRVKLDNNTEDTSTDKYGDPLRFVRACSLKGRLRPKGGPVAEWNYAIIAFIGSLPDDTPIVLYWS